MATRGIVTTVGGARPWIARYGDGTSPAQQPFQSLRSAQIPIEAAAGGPIRWRQLVESDGTHTLPETWVAEDLPTPAIVAGGQGPWSYAPGGTIAFLVDGAPIGASIAATPGIIDASAAGPYTIVDGTISVSIVDAAGVVGVVINTHGVVPGTAQTAAAAAAWLNANAVPPGAGVAFRDDGAGVLELATTDAGSAIGVMLVGGGALAVSLGFGNPTYSDMGGGNVPQASAITAADAVAMLAPQLNVASPVVAVYVNRNGAVSVATNTYGSTSSIQRAIGGSTFTLDMDSSVHYGLG